LARDPNVKTHNLIAQPVSIAIWAMLSAIFLFDILTPPENISVCLAYAVPIFLSLYETQPRPMLYASTATVLSLIGGLIQSPAAISRVIVAANLLIAIVLQWLVALLVRLQIQHVTAMLEKAESQRRFVNVLSHEVGTALTVIGGQASRLTKLSVPEDLKRRAEKIRDAARRVELFIDRIRFASSFGDGTIPIERGAVNLHAVLQQLTEQLREENRGRVIELSLYPEPQIVAGDEMLIRQMFENVIMNSLKYSPTDRKISVSITKRDSLARITIVDHGSGMSQYDLSRIRSPFFRGENSKGISGTGIGLYVVEQIVEAHKGRLFIESALGAGTTVVLDLPQSAEVARA
jgi:signal transduction histidine kinase